MSRVGKAPIPVPGDVKVTVADGKVRVEGKKAKLELTYHPDMQVKFDAGAKQIMVTRPNDERQFKIFHDIRALVADDLAQPIYSEELARKLGLSVRSLHDVVRRYRGMSLHRYLRLRRLWLVRQRLLAGAESVKAVALAFGFWHLSDFSRSYRDQFGETPSATLERGRRR